MPRTSLLGLLLLLVPGPGPQGGPADAAAPRVPSGPAPVAAPLAFALGGDSPSLVIPRGEQLKFGVHVALGPVGANVGTVAMTSRVAPYQESLVMLGSAAGGDRETGWLRARAEGSYLWYDLDTILDSRYLPQVWPSVSHSYSQSGSENRRRETLIGVKDEASHALYRRDTNKGAPDGQRIWKAPEERAVPAGTVDMLGAVYLARTLLDDGGDEPLEQLVFPLLDKTDLWHMTLRRGRRAVVDVPAGRFHCVQVVLEPSTWPGEPEVEPGEFKGLFGISGSIDLWVEESTGVPVRIAGAVPAGPFSIACDIFLTSFEGTPEAFVPIPAGEVLEAGVPVEVSEGHDEG